MTTHTENLKLPALSLQDGHGKTWNVPTDFLGKWTILYFYPKDDTPGCTIQACTYRDEKQYWEKSGLVVLGVSADGVDSHKEFTQKFDLNFPLLADVNNQLSQALGVWGEQEWGGKKYMGLSRDSFLINPQGEIVKIWRKVNPKETVTETVGQALEWMKK